MWLILNETTDIKLFESRIGTKGETINVGLGPIAPEIIELPTTEELTWFRLLDDDRNFIYSGQLHNDDEALNQQAALSFGMNDAGCTIIEVKINDEWKQEIG